jgi:hypothetical protein
VEVPPGFAEALERMAAAVTRVRAARVAPLAELASGEAADALRAAFAEAGAASIPAGPSRYWPSRLSVVGREPGGRLRAVLSSEPLMPVLRGLDEARGSWERALGLFEQHRTALEPADPRDLIGNLVRRDAARRYDDERRRAHLELVLEAVLPNLVETITLDPAAILELALDGSLPAEPLGVVAIRQSTAVNQFLGEDDASFAATVAPLTVALVLPDGSARLTRLPFPPSGQEWVTLPQAPPRGERRAP